MRIPLIKGADGTLALEIPDDLLQKLTSKLSSKPEGQLKESQDKPAELEGKKGKREFKTWWDLTLEDREKFGRKVANANVQGWEELKQAANDFGFEPTDDMPTIQELKDDYMGISKGKKSLVDQVAAWVDPESIAEMILSNMKKEGIPATFENAKTVWYSVLEMLGASFAEGKLANGDARTMDDFTPTEKAAFVIPWLQDLATTDFVKLARHTGHEAQLVPAAAAEVAEVPAEGETRKEELFLQGKTDLPGYKYFPHVDLSVKE